MDITSMAGISQFSGDHSSETVQTIGQLFQMSYWQSGIAFAYVIVTIIALTWIYRKFGRNKAVIWSFIIGGLGLMMFSLFYSYTPPPIGSEYSWVNEAESWLSLITTVFIGLIFFGLPIYIFTSIIKAINLSGDDKPAGKTYTVSFLLMVSLVIIGILVAFALLPLMNLWAVPVEVPNSGTGTTTEIVTITGIISSWVPYSVSIFGSATLIVAVVVAAVIFGFLTKHLRKSTPKTGEATYTFFMHLHKVFSTYMKWILVLVPYVIATRLAMVLMGEQVYYLTSIGYLIAIYAIGYVIIFAILIGISIAFMKGKNRFKRYFAATRRLWVDSFANSNVPATIPTLMSTSQELGVCEELSTFNGSLGSSFGLIMCGAFFPTLLSLYSLVSYDQFNVTVAVIIFFTVIFVSMGSSGMSTVDIFILTTTLATIGYDSAQIEQVVGLAIILLTFLESFNIVNNMTGHLTAAIVAERYHRRLVDHKIKLRNPINNLNQTKK